MGPAIEKARAAQVAAMMVRICMGFLLLPIGWSSFFIVSSRPCRHADYGHRTGQSRGMKSTWGPGSIMNTASVARTHATKGTWDRTTTDPVQPPYREAPDLLCSKPP